TQDHTRLAVLHHQRSLQSAAWPLARCERIRFARLQRVVVATAIEDETEVAHDHTGAEGTVQTRGESDHVARAVNYSDIAGIAIMIAVAGHRYLHRTIERRLIAGKLLSSAWTKLERRRAFVNHRAPFGSIFFREQALIRNFDKVQIAQILVTIGEGEFGRFDAGVNVLRAVVAQRLQVVAFENSKSEQLCRALAGRSVLVDLIAMIIDRNGLFDFGGIVGKVFVTKQAAVLL